MDHRRGKITHDRPPTLQRALGPQQVLGVIARPEMNLLPHVAAQHRADVVEAVQLDALFRRIRVVIGMFRQIRFAHHFRAAQIQLGFDAQFGGTFQRRNLARADASDLRVFKMPRHPLEARFVRRISVLHGQKNQLARRRGNPGITRQAVVERRFQFHKTPAAIKHALARVVARARIDGNDFKRRRGLLSAQRRDQTRDVRTRVERRNDHRDLLHQHEFTSLN